MATKYVWPLVTSLLIAVFGAVLMAWPFAMHANVGGWTRATTTDFWSGMGLALVGLLGVAGWYAGLRQELVRRGFVTIRRATPDAPVATAPEPSHDEDLDRLLRPLAETVLRDLSTQLAAKEGRVTGGGGAS